MMKSFSQHIKEANQEDPQLFLTTTVEGTEYVVVKQEDNFKVLKNGKEVYSTSDAVGPYALGEMFLKLMSEWALIEEKLGRENPGDLIDKTIFEVICQNMIKNNTVINGENRDKLIEVLESVTKRNWDQRSV